MRPHARKATAAPLPLAQADLRAVRVVLTDVDGTLTTGGRLLAGTVAAMEALQAAGVRVVLVSGRPAGWGECWARTLPVDGVIVENGGLYFVPSASGVRKVYVQAAEVREVNRARLRREVDRVLRKVPGARLSMDSASTEVDLAIDYNEEAKLGADAASRIEELLRARGLQAVRSSVHVNCWAGQFDKLSTGRQFLEAEWGLTLRREDRRFIYAGDSFNDAPMFAGFSLSVGVANIRPVLPSLSHSPAFITRAAEGAGFCELARAILRQRRGGRKGTR